MATGFSTWEKLKDTRSRLQKCFEVDLDWNLYPKTIKDGCEQVGKAMNVPASAVLLGYVILGSFMMSPSAIKVPGTDWVEPVLVWITVCMDSGSGKSIICKHIYDIMEVIRSNLGLTIKDPSWVFEDGSFEKMGAMMEENSCRLLGCYDELSAFLTRINLYSGKSLSNSHELAVFLQLYNGHPWRRDTVSGGANFAMSSPMLTIGGFTQPGVARSLIEQPSNSERGLSSRFLWFFPECLYGSFKSLCEVDKEFIAKIIGLFEAQWRSPTGNSQALKPRQLTLLANSKTFEEYYDEIQKMLKSLAGVDELLTGMLSKSRGQVLRVAAVMHMLFSIDNNDYKFEDIVSEAALKAAINLVETSCQQTAFVAGRGLLQEEVESPTCTPQPDLDSASPGPKDETISTEAVATYCLTLPGKKLYLSPLLAAKKFKRRGNKEKAVAAFAMLETEGLGTLLEVGGARGAMLYEFEKAQIPEDKEEKMKLIKKLSKFEVSLSQYQRAFELPGHLPISEIAGVKRKLKET